MKIYNRRVEQMLLGTLLMENTAIKNVNRLLKAEHFYFKKHRDIYRLITNFIAKNMTADPCTLKNFFNKNKYLWYLARLACTIIDVPTYSKLIHELALRREIAGLGEQIISDAYNFKDMSSAADIVKVAKQKLYIILA